MSAEFDFAIHEQFRDALFNRGIVPPDNLIDDGRLHRCDVEGREGAGDASYLLHCDGFPAGGFQNWCDGTGWENWRADLDHPPTAEELDELRRKGESDLAQREAEATARRAEAARKAAGIWTSAAPCSVHPYLSRKRVQPHGLRVTAHGHLVVPMRDAGGLMHSLQFIMPDGGKTYLQGGRVQGCLYQIGTPADVALIGEGFATCASVHEATGHPVAVAFDCGNLKPVALALRAKHPAARIVLLADDDYRTSGNPGLTKSREAAAAVGGHVAIPDFGASRPDYSTDFNDLAVHAGAGAVRACIEQALTGEPEPAAPWPAPDRAILHLNRREPPVLPLEVFGESWSEWIAAAAEAAAAPVDYVVMPLLAVASTLIGNARWPQATPGWTEPPHLWVGEVGDSGSSKSPGADPLLRGVVPELERRMNADFPDRLRLWRAAAEIVKAAEESWKGDVRAARKANREPPAALELANIGPEPQAPRLRQNDVTIEKLALVLAAAAPKGVLVVRDELAGWLLSLSNYNEGGRAFWIEAYGGRSYRVERVKHPEPITVPYLAVSVFGGIQPDRIAELSFDGDDGLLARFIWSWPDPIPFRLSRRAPQTAWAIDCLDRLRLLEPLSDDPPRPITVPLADEALALLEKFARDLQERQKSAGGLMRSALGKMRGLAIRLSLVFEMLWWCAATGADAPPTTISVKAFAAAAALIDRYFILMAERVYGDAALPDGDRHAATIARWIMRAKPTVINAREIRRTARLPGLREADKVKLALNVLVEGDWIIPAFTRAGGSRGRLKEDYAVNPRVFEEAAS